ncbi:MAG: PHP domain-containing protein [Pseudomonadales bacterium]|nr:PHP domain-containing protein [Pseudomonadales bacterium]
MIDLHTHTRYSDGALSPAALVRRAIANGVRCLAITDHDSVAAFQSQAEEPDTLEASDIDLQLIRGVELSSLWQGREIHILGLVIDPENETLNHLLTRQQQLRRERAARINEQLCQNGITGLEAYLDSLPCQAIGRNHIADFLITTGYARDKQQAFSKYLGNKGKYRTQPQWCTLAEAVEHIAQAGGISLVAHPERYRLSNGKLGLLLDDFQAAGGQGLEVSYSNLAPEQLYRLARLCQTRKMWASQGSDFHSPEATWMDVGKIRGLPPECREQAVWLHPSWPTSETASGQANRHPVSADAGTQSNP